MVDVSDVSAPPIAESAVGDPLAPGTALPHDIHIGAVLEVDADSILYAATRGGANEPLQVLEFCPALVARRRAGGALASTDGSDGLVRTAGAFLGRARALQDRPIPLIEPPLGSFAHNGTGYALLPLPAGEPIEAWWAGQPGDPATLHRLIATLCDAIGAAHARGTVHGALSPATIRIADGGVPRIVSARMLPLTPAGIAQDIAGLARTFERLVGERGADHPAFMLAAIARGLGEGPTPRSLAAWRRDLLEPPAEGEPAVGGAEVVAAAAPRPHRAIGKVGAFAAVLALAGIAGATLWWVGPPAPRSGPLPFAAPRVDPVEAATDRAALLALLAEGRDAGRIRERLAALGHVPVPSAGATLWRVPGAGEPFRDCPTCPELVVVPAGEVRIALGADERRVVLATPFAVGRSEVTRAEFRAFLAATGHALEPGCYSRTPSWRLDPALSWETPGYPQDDSHPVACVSWRDARAYVDWLSRTTGEAYSLPTDAAWHHIATGPPATAASQCEIANGADASARAVHPNWSVADCDDGHAHTAPVRRYRANGWGVHDLAGNLWEWVADCAPAVATGDAPACPDQAARLIRGGSFSDPPAMLAAEVRLVSDPSLRDQIVGFRVVRALAPPS